MKKILIYGDSNTWGDNFILGERIPDECQWPNILQKSIGSNFKVIQEGLPGRLAGDEENEKTFKNGKNTFISTFRTQAPVDIMIISLGTNDLQLKYNKSYDKILKDLLWYKEIIANMYEDLEDRKKYFVNESMPQIIYILPINFDYIENAKIIFDKNCEEKRQKIIQEFPKYVDSDTKIISFNDLTLFDDGIHLNYEGHKKLASEVEEVLDMIKNENLLRFRKSIKMDVYGLENIPDNGVCIFIANHNCLMDIFYLPAALKNDCVSLISPRLMYKKDISRQDTVKRLLYSMPIEAHGGTKYAQMCLEQAVSILCSGIDVAIFPEGAYIEPNNNIFKGRTGASRILFDAKSKGIDINFIPVAIEVISNNLDLDNYNVCDDKINIYILDKVDYEKDYTKYIESNEKSVKNMALHSVVELGMKSIAKALNKVYCDDYIVLRPKKNVIFRDGSTVDTYLAQECKYLKKYEDELLERKKEILDILKS